MEPEDRLDDEVEERRQVVAATKVSEFVRDHGLHLLVRESLANGTRPQQHGADNAEDAGLEERVGASKRQRFRAAHPAFERVQGLHFTSTRQRDGIAGNRQDAVPLQKRLPR